MNWAVFGEGQELEELHPRTFFVILTKNTQERREAKQNFIPKTPVSLKECLTQLSQFDHVWLHPTEALYWLIGYHEQITVQQALALIEQYGLENHKAYLKLGGGNRAFGIYGQGPDGKGWCLFEMVRPSDE